MSKHKTVKSLISSLEKKLKVVTEEVFMEKVNNISKKLKSVSDMSRAMMIRYLTSFAGSSKFPKVRSGNLVKNLPQGKFQTNPIITRNGSVIKATFKGWYGVDTQDIGGLSHTVHRTTGKNSPAPYAYFLNTLSKYKKYNGYFDKAMVAYSKELNDNLDHMLNQELGSYRLKKGW